MPLSRKLRNFFNGRARADERMYVRTAAKIYRRVCELDEDGRHVNARVEKFASRGRESRIGDGCLRRRWTSHGRRNRRGHLVRHCFSSVPKHQLAHASSAAFSTALFHSGGVSHILRFTLQKYRRNVADQVLPNASRTSWRPYLCCTLCIRRVRAHISVSSIIRLIRSTIRSRFASRRDVFLSSGPNKN